MVIMSVVLTGVSRVPFLIVPLCVAFGWGGVVVAVLLGGGVVFHSGICPFPNADGADEGTLHGFFCAIAVEACTLRAITTKRDQLTTKTGAGTVNRHGGGIGRHF